VRLLWFSAGFLLGVTETTFRQTLQCPKLTTRPGSAQIIQEAITSDYY